MIHSRGTALWAPSQGQNTYSARALIHVRLQAVQQAVGLRVAIDAQPHSCRTHAVLKSLSQNMRDMRMRNIILHPSPMTMFLEVLLAVTLSTRWASAA